MPEIFNSDYKDTDVAKRFIKKYNTNTGLFALGLFVIVASLIPYLLIRSEDQMTRILPSIIMILIGAILIFIGVYRNNRLKELNVNKYTVTALDYIDSERKRFNQFYRRDIIIGILLIIISPLIYFMIKSKASFLPENVDRYVSAILVLLLSVGLFIIFNSKGKKDVYNFIRKNI